MKRSRLVSAYKFKDSAEKKDILEENGKQRTIWLAPYIVKKIKSRFRLTKLRAFFACVFVSILVLYLSLPHIVMRYYKYKSPRFHLRTNDGLPPPMNIEIGVATFHFFQQSFFGTKDCKARNQTFKCTTKMISHHNASIYHVKLFHAPHTSTKKVKRDFPSQLLGVISMEPGAIYKHQNNPAFMNRFDIKQYFRWDSDVPTLYSTPYINSNMLFNPVPIPTEIKIPALVYINSNCHASNGRNEIVRKMMMLRKIPVHSYGGCLNNKQAKKNENKEEIIAKYKFCITMENSNEEDYVSEKLWQSLKAGCLPIYYGAPNIDKFLPVPANQIILNYNDFDSPEALSDELVRLNNNDEEYNKYFEWKKLNPETDKLLEGFQWLMKQAKRNPTCDFCRRAQTLWETRKDTTDFEYYKKQLFKKSRDKDENLI